MNPWWRHSVTRDVDFLKRRVILSAICLVALLILGANRWYEIDVQQETEDTFMIFYRDRITGSTRSTLQWPDGQTSYDYDRPLLAHLATVVLYGAMLGAAVCISWFGTDLNQLLREKRPEKWDE